MFGFYEIKMPRFLTKQTSLSIHGSFIYSFLFGMVSGTIASPCLTPALAVILSFVAKVGNPFLGLLVMWFFAMGMGLLLIVIGTFSTTITLMPRSGTWMLEVKKVMGFVLLIMCVYFLQPFFTENTLYKMYSLVCFIGASYYFSTSKRKILKIILATIFTIIGILLLTKGMIKNKNFYVHNSMPSIHNIYNNFEENA